MAIPGLRPGEKLTQFIERKIRVESHQMDQYNAQVDQLVRFLEQSLSRQQVFSVKRIVKSGSLGKGTAISERSDIDLIVFFNKLSNIECLRVNMENLLQLLKQTIESSSEYNGRLSFRRKTPYSIGYNFDGDHEVDLLPAWDVVSEYSPDNIYRKMSESPPEIQRYYSQCLSPLQISFIKPLPAKVKDAIRLLKYWYKKEGVPLPNSYCLELIAVYEWRKYGSLFDFDMDKFFKDVLQQLVDCHRLQVSFNTNYALRNYCTHQTPYVVDPADPFRNTLSPFPRPQDVSQSARKTLQLLG